MSSSIPKKILICGFMGSGKTTLGEKWSAEESPYIFNDLDTLIFQSLANDTESMLGETIERVGWEEFRKMEESLLLEHISSGEQEVLILGGGALSKEIVDKLSKCPDCHLVFLDTPFEECLRRVGAGEGRPLVGKGPDKLRELYEQRLPLYQSAGTILNAQQQRQTFQQFLASCRLDDQ